MFRAAGLDPERPPRTIEELDQANARLTTKDQNGGLQTVGLVPWQWGGANSIFTWGYAFGGDFYELPSEAHPNGRVTADHPRVVAALDWMANFARTHDIRKVNAYNSQFVGVSNNPFYLGKQGMSILHATQVKYLRQYAPNVEWGIGLVPAPPEGEYPTGWIGGWSLGIPRSRAVRPEAFAFIRWMCTSETATRIAAEEMEQFPAFRKSGAYAAIGRDPERRVFLDILENSRHVRTLMPVQGYFMTLLGRGVDEVLYGNRDPGAALAEASHKAQVRLDQVLGAVKRRPEKPN
jgi:multiple sugar transport system substrate-binding protein